MKRKFKIGDRVKVIENDEGLLNKIGTITFIDNDNVPYLVEFDEEMPFGHDGGNRKGKDGHCLFFCEHDLKLANSKPARVIFKDNATILFKDGKKYVAKCCDGDTYDREKGLLVCLAKAHGYTFNDLQEMLESAEAPKGKVREVNREAKVGEYIKIVNAKENENRHGKGFAYKNGDILKVKETRSFGSVTTNTLKGKGSNLLLVKGYNYLRKDEYVVLENYKPNKYKITLSEFWKSEKKLAIEYKNEEQGELVYKALIKKGLYNKINEDVEYTKGYDCVLNDKKCYAVLINQTTKKGAELNSYTIYKFNEVDLNN